MFLPSRPFWLLPVLRAAGLDELDNDVTEPETLGGIY